MIYVSILHNRWKGISEKISTLTGHFLSISLLLLFKLDFGNHHALCSLPFVGSMIIQLILAVGICNFFVLIVSFD